MADIFGIDAPDLSQGYVNIRDAKKGPEAETRSVIENMWREYEPYADPDFCHGFARDMDARFWEMLLGCTLLRERHQLLASCDRAATGGQPDLCVIEGDRRIWIEAITPTRGDAGPDAVPDLEFGKVAAIPIQQTRIRLTSAFWTKYRKFAQYLEDGVVGPEDRLVIAISGSRFAVQILDDPPLPLTSLFPAGNEVMTVNRETGEVVGHGLQYQPTIPREAGEIPRSAFAAPCFEIISAILWSRIGLGNLSRETRPFTIVHNPFAKNPVEHGWGPWDREYVARETEKEWIINNIRVALPR